ncbi:MAG: sigma-70 family RNA polymerase sigma factor, partial [bacterium]|nr:sigma-70 family RNA polymerase sigma factor [bacterium]
QWMATFADLMALLLCFFVLLLSFSEMDVLKYKQVAGSMAQAFGVQNEITADGIPKGPSVIAQEFSPGKPQPTLDPIIQQQTVDNSEQSLQTGQSDFGVDSDAIESTEATAEEIAERADMNAMEVRRVMSISKHPVSLDRPVGESEDSNFGDFIEDTNQDAPAVAAARDMLKGRIEMVLKTLTYREREIIKLRYGIGDGYTYTLEEVGRIFKVTRERVRQVEAKAIRKLQHPVRSRKLEGFVDS